MTNPVIVLEFNELTPSLMEKFINEGHLPGFKRLRDQSIVAVTDAQEAWPTLEPWIQWITVHTGLSYAQHKVFDLSDGPKLKAPSVWDIVSDAGDDVWVCGSMNASVQKADIRGLVIPDPWAVGVPPKPEAFFRPYFHFVRSYVQQYTSDKSPVTRADAMKFVRFMVGNGLSLKTVMTTLRQLMSERGGSNRWRRAAILDRLQWDMFRSNYRRLKPTLSTFFLNSTAHYQHYYWRNHEPDLFAIKPSEDHQTEHADALLFGYQKMDQIVQECFELAGDKTSIILCTALSQQPMLKYEEIGGKQVFKVTDISMLLNYAGVTEAYQHVPVMAEEFRLIFASEDDAKAAEAKLMSLSVNDAAPLMRVRRDDCALFTACALVQIPPEGSTFEAPTADTPVLFNDYFYPLEGVKSGMHHPDGMLWISTPERRHQIIDRKVSLQEIAPTLLALCGVKTSVVFEKPPISEVVTPLAQRRAA